MLDGDETHLVFTYGSNLDAARMAERCPSATGRRAARLLDHRLVFDKIALDRDGTGYANAVVAKGEVVEGGLYEISRDDLLRLDRFEGHPHHYSRRLMAVVEADGERNVAWVYFATPDFRATSLVPRPEYVAHLLAGRDLLSTGYAARLDALAAR